MRRVRYELLIAILAALATDLIAPAAAQTSRDIDLCDGKGGASFDQIISGCTALIEAGKESRRNRIISFNNRGNAYDEKGEYDLAIADFDEAISLSPKDAGLYNNRAIAYTHKRDYDRALSDYDEAIRLNPKYAEAFFNRGLLYRDKKVDLDLALQDFNQAIRFNPKYSRAFGARGYLYREKGEFDRALGDLNTAIKLDPKNANFYYHRGRIYWAKGGYDRAIADFDEYIRRDSGYAWVFYYRGRVHKSQGNSDRARQDYDQALRLEPDIVSALLKSGNEYLNKGFRDKREFDRAIEYYDGAIELDPTSAKTYAARALAYLHKEGVDRAIQDYDQAIALDPDFSDALLGRGRMYRNKQQYGRAVEDYDRVLAVLAKGPADDVAVVVGKAAVLSERCYARSLLGQLPEALSDCEEASRLQPTTPPLHNRAPVFLKLGRFDDAIADYNAILRTMPRDAGSIYGRGLAKLKKGDSAGGNADIAAAKAIDPNVTRSFSAWYGVGDEAAKVPTERAPPAPAAETPSGAQVAPREASVAADATLLRELRERLYELNFDPGAAGTQIGEADRQAVLDFENKNDLPRTGEPNLALLERLRAAGRPSPWGAIVFAKATGKWGMAWGHASRKEAVAGAVSSCGDARQCNVELSFYGSECGAFAFGGASWALAARASGERAKEAALADCQKGGRACRVVASVCASGPDRAQADKQE